MLCCFFGTGVERVYQSRYRLPRAMQAWSLLFAGRTLLVRHHSHFSPVLERGACRQKGKALCEKSSGSIILMLLKTPLLMPFSSRKPNDKSIQKPSMRNRGTWKTSPELSQD